jgi:hypothetical protein
VSCQFRLSTGLCGLPARWRCTLCGDCVCARHRAEHFKVVALP